MRCWPRRLLHFNGAAFLPSWPRAHGRGRIRLGFLGGSLFRYENPRFELLDLFGFPWILSFESRLFVKRDKRGTIFRAAFYAGVGIVTKLRSWRGKASLRAWS
jgi:hypothetical protein